MEVRGRGRTLDKDKKRRQTKENTIVKNKKSLVTKKQERGRDSNRKTQGQKENKISLHEILNAAINSEEKVTGKARVIETKRSCKPSSDRFEISNRFYDSISSSPSSVESGEEKDCSQKIHFVRIVRTGNTQDKVESEQKSQKPKADSRNKEILDPGILNKTKLRGSKEISKIRKQNEEGLKENSRGRFNSPDTNKKTRQAHKTKSQFQGRNETREKSKSNSPGEGTEESFKQNILPFKTRNSLIKKRFKERAEEDFFSSLTVLTPNNSCSRKVKSLSSDNSPDVSTLTPDIPEMSQLKTGLTPVNSNNSGNSSIVTNGKIPRRRDYTKKSVFETLHLSPLSSSSLKEFVSGEESNGNSSHSRNMASKSIGDILGGLENSAGSKTVIMSKLSCERQNKFITQLHEKLFNKSNEEDYSPGLKDQGNNPKVLAAKYSHQLKKSLDSVLDQEMEAYAVIADQEKQQELLWSITEDSSLEKEDRDRLVEELIAQSSYK
ncbi:hypothetical protein HWI79_3100 [Cryptosporidium felis]|nr:hypothetical protein HWI79_3100 [Cryptosporidium felis]